MSDDYKLVKQDIVTGSGVLAYTRGQRIAADAVTRNGWDDYVVGRDTTEARSILAEITGDPVDDSKPARSGASSSKGE